MPVPGCRGKRIVIDPGHGGQDRGVVVDGLSEADLMLDLARRLEGKMAATGMEALLTRGPANCPDEAERAKFANEAGADLILSLHTDAQPLAARARRGDVPLRDRQRHVVDRR